uniref:Uncharacterized protein n=1 Tax=Anguilla anguilla TaxID=7936 RepID=A0A0E9V9A5_ANGAN
MSTSQTLSQLVNITNSLDSGDPDMNPLE